jgi:hypothetical protein
LAHLIALVIAIAISGFVILGGGNLINFGKFDKIRVKNEILSDYTTLISGRTMYMEHTDQQLSILNWEDEIKEYAFLPNGIEGLNWVYNQSVNGVYFCLTGNIEAIELYEAIQDFSDTLGQNSYYINTNCGVTENFAVTPDFSLLPQVSVTFYVK